MLDVGETIERYRVEAILGGGVLATVYRVRHLQLDTVHALKVLTATSPSDRARLFAEGQIQAKLRHPNVVGVTDLLLVNRAPALVLELVEGPSLQRWLGSSGGRIPLYEGLALFRGIVSGVGVAHAAGLVHRDLRPSNVLLAPGRGGSRIAKVTDFGFVWLGGESPLTRTGSAIGNPAYTAPEQLRNPSAVDVRADLWALGCMLYELVSGGRAFPATDPAVLFEDVVAGRYVDLARSSEPPPLRVTDVIRDLLRTDPAARIVSCAHLWERLWDDPVPSELYGGEQLRLEVPLALEPSVSLPVPLEGGALDGAVIDDSGLEAPPTLIPPEDLFHGFDGLGDAPSEASEPMRVPSRVRPAVRPWWAWPLGLGAAVIASVPVVAVVLVLFGSSGPPAPAPVQALAVIPPRPAPVAPEVVPVVPVVAPEPPPAPKAKEARPRPANGTISVEGDAAEVWLEASGRRVEAKGSIPAGKYVVRASFGDSVTRNAGEIQIRPGAKTRVRCASFVYACTQIDR